MAPSFISLAAFFWGRLLKTTTGIDAVTGSVLRACRTSCPPSLGSNISKRIKSGLLEWAIRNPSSPSLAVTTSYPARASAISFARRINLLSSIKRIDFKESPSRPCMHAESQSLGAGKHCDAPVCNRQSDQFRRTRRIGTSVRRLREAQMSRSWTVTLQKPVSSLESE